MAKFASKDEKVFNPIQEKLLGGLVRPVPTGGVASPSLPTPLAAEAAEAPQSEAAAVEPRAERHREPDRLNAPPEDRAMSPSPLTAPAVTAAPPSPAHAAPDPLAGASWDAGTEERLTRTLRCLMTPEDEQRYKEFALRLSRALVTPPSLRGRDRGETPSHLSLSHLVRACLEFLITIEPQLYQELQEARLARPNNDRRAIAAFEAKLTRVIERACRTG
jgi:hypothetical protein